DLLAVVLMVLLSTMAATRQFAGKEMVWALAKLLFFVIFWFVVGMYVIPTLFGKGRKFMNEEMLTVLSIGLCFGMVVLANIAGFSSALGAFIMGSLLSETLEGEQIEHQVKGIKDLFGAVFFVSVGMLVDPSIILQYWKPILILTVTVLLMRPLFATIGVMLGGSGLRASVRSGMSVGLVGEFGFILVSQGVALGVMREFLYPVIVAVSVITTFIAPYCMKAGEPLGIWLEKKVPSRLQRFIQPVPEVTRGKEKKNEWKRLLTMYFTRVLVYGVLLLAIWIGANHWLYDFVTGHLTGISSFWQKMVCIGVTLVVMAPFLAGMMSNTAEHRNLILHLWDDGSYNRGPLMALLILRVFAAVCIVLAVIYHYFSMSLWVLIPTALALLVLFLNIRRNIHKLNFMEAKFLRNLSEKERRERSVKPMTTSLKEMLADKDLQVENLQVSGDSPFIGQQLSQLDIRAKYHVMILKIIRGSRFINLPQANEYIYPADGLVVIGSKENIADFKAVATLSEVPSEQQKDVFMGSFMVGAKAIIAGKNLIQIGFRNSSVALIAVERGANFYLNPDGQFVIKAGDKVWLLGDEAACHRFV
ncbi:MAG: cation:proton antiporter, partial [Bacteroidales bacterium]|nr:cation:proton antiporter [Candidatus Equibacterium intestinale]